MTYVREQTSEELAAHMRSLQRMAGWFEPLADRLWQEVEALQATIANQAQMIEHLRGGLTTPTHIDVANADADGFKNGRKSVGLITGKAFTSFDKSGGRYRVTMDFQFKDDALRAYNELSQVAELAAKP